MAYKNPEDAKEYRMTNSERIIERVSKWAKENPEKRKIIVMNHAWKKNGILLDGNNFKYEDFNRMFAEQEGKCKICKTHQSDLPKALSVDHDHFTGEARGLLCQKCNTLLGMSKDDISILKSAIEYLQKK